MNQDIVPSSSLQPGSIFCVGKNYPDHAREMASWEPEKSVVEVCVPDTEPVIFMKPGSALSRTRKTSIPCFNGLPVSSSLHYEAELVLLVSRDAEEVRLEDAMSYIGGYAAGLDMTLRDVQLEAKRAGNPWLKSKGFRQSALVSDFIPVYAAGLWAELSISLHLDGRLVQYAPVSNMTFSPAYLIHYLSCIYGLRKGDLIFTGTPSGVGPVLPGNRLTASLETGNGPSEAPLTLVSLEATVF